ncbi:MAG: thioredoxin fold domain-containing protein [gamma proteobacterium symbiont of Lucinoma myriamae]|nr:thioredoxin fold domain-containing protein [gamma proteobacterium symbiont of Lucinoma myriamae]MCU7819010.1 thioredoxin fold domain-containing protein [gamma proteobacterium symbiont of Lucinoma myriamae]MCU7832061.1 thioredoxin fold domain-containing protein [gamma proteobacterium symbiont of Lucinoma myriamae]
MNKIQLIKLIFTFLFLSICSNFIFAGHSGHSDRPKLKQITDIRETAQLAKAANLPILMMFGTDECPYCTLLKEDFLIPMIISGDYTDKVILREVHVVSPAAITDFSGKKISINEFSERYGVRLFPTMVFVDGDGQVLVKNIMGITTPSLFGGTLDDQIDKALAMTQKKLP